MQPAFVSYQLVLGLHNTSNQRAYRCGPRSLL